MTQKKITITIKESQVWLVKDLLVNRIEELQGEILRKSIDCGVLPFCDSWLEEECQDLWSVLNQINEELNEK